MALRLLLRCMPINRFGPVNFFLVHEYHWTKPIPLPLDQTYTSITGNALMVLGARGGNPIESYEHIYKQTA